MYMGIAMSSLIDDTDKEDYQNALLDVFDTFKRKLVFYLEPKKVVISTNPSYSMFGDNSQNTDTVQLQPQRFEIYGTIKHQERQEFPYVDDKGETKVKVMLGKCRIKISAADAARFMTAKNFEVDGMSYRLNSGPRPHGLFTPALYTFYLERSE